jgi:hypothetical protein
VLVGGEEAQRVGRSDIACGDPQSGEARGSWGREVLGQSIGARIDRLIVLDFFGSR